MWFWDDKALLVEPTFVICSKKNIQELLEVVPNRLVAVHNGGQKVNQNLWLL